MSSAYVNENSPISEAKQAEVHKRTLTVVIVSQILGGAGLAAGISVGALLAQDMLGSDSLSGVPAGLFTLGSALAAYTVGRSTQSFGRRLGLAYGFIAGGLGALGVVIAAISENIPLLFIALFIYGSGTATNLQARYAGTDLAPADKRGFGTSVAMVATTIGAVAGPNLIGPMGRLAESLGVPALAGPFMLAALAYSSAGVVLFVFLRPDPYLLAKQIERDQDARDPSRVAGETTIEIPRIGTAAYIGGLVMVLTQLVMVVIMTMTPIHMRAHDHNMDAIGMVIGLHIGAMWLPSLVTGILVDRYGRTPMVVAAGFTLLAAGLLAALTPADSLVGLTLALVLLGLGWNFGLVAGTALVVDATVPLNRPQTQGKIDVFIALAGAAGAAISGFVLHITSFQLLSIVAGVLSLVLIPALFWARKNQ